MFISNLAVLEWGKPLFGGAQQGAGFGTAVVETQGRAAVRPHPWVDRAGQLEMRGIGQWQ
jgi:hypothetical protein